MSEKYNLQLIANIFPAAIKDDKCRPPAEVDVLGEPVRELLGKSLAANTRRGYASDLTVFARWGGVLPANSVTVSRFVADLSGTHSVASINRMLSALGKAHRSAGHDDPTKAEIVKATMAGIRRTFGRAQRQTRPILRDDLFAMLDQMSDRPKDIRDRSMLLLGFATAMRRSELVALDMDDVEVSARGLTITVRRSKTDQEGHGRQIAVPPGRTRHCPIAAFNDWVAVAQLGDGPIFRGVDKHGNILSHRLSGEAVSHVIKTRLYDAGYDPTGYSGHSLRSGFVTAAAMAGAPSYKIRETTGHRSDLSMSRYLRQVELFLDPAISRIL